MIQINKEKPSEKEWRLLAPNEVIYHMFGVNGEYNLKFVSFDGLFEAVYNKNCILLTSSNDAINMGTYNYADPENSPVQHGLYDVIPYYQLGNVAQVPKPNTSGYENLDRYEANSDAQNHYNKIYKQIYD